MTTMQRECLGTGHFIDGESEGEGEPCQALSWLMAYAALCQGRRVYRLVWSRRRWVQRIQPPPFVLLHNNTSRTWFCGPILVQSVDGRAAVLAVYAPTLADKRARDWFTV